MNEPRYKLMLKWDDDHEAIACIDDDRNEFSLEEVGEEADFFNNNNNVKYKYYIILI